MAKLEGIIYTAFRSYIVLRGFAPIGGLARISKKPASYQRDADEQHKVEIVHYLNDLKSYFPEITLACRVSDYEGLMRSIGDDKDVSKEDSVYVKGLRILSERLPIGRDRARHAYLEIDNPNEDEKLIRVDGNHRLEPFNSNIEWWYKFVTDKTPIKDETDPEKINGWLKHQAQLYRKGVAGKIVPFTIIMSDAKDADNFEAKIFHDINFKALPLREEASLRIISELQAFDNKESLGKEYPLALDLIDIVKTGQFNAIPWLANEMDISKSYYRTSCLAIARLLHFQKEILRPQMNDDRDEKKRLKANLKEIEQKISDLAEQLKVKNNEIHDIELKFSDFTNMTLYKQTKSEIRQLDEELRLMQNEKRELENKKEHLKYKFQKLRHYIKYCDDKTVILDAINSLIGVYNTFDKDSYGNIAFLCTLVYYAILDKAQMLSFIDWAERNGINKITEPDDLSKDAPANLIKMFEQIYRAKKNEIFISMQFGDSQSELIYEKIVRAVEKFNAKHKSIHLNATPIRIDRTVESSTFSIQNKILKAIKSCSLIIADLSSANINVYHEIGYAMGVAESHNMIPNMILLYKENTDHNEKNIDVDKFVGFNLRNLSQLRFKDYVQLVDGLVERLEKHYGVS